MKIKDTDQQSLASLGAEAAEMLALQDYSGLVARFGYALCQGREPVAAIEADHQSAVASPITPADDQPITVKYFQANSAGFFALVECMVPVHSGAAVLLELVVTGQNEKHITIEDISGA